VQQESSLATSRRILWWFSLSFLYNHYFRGLIIQEGSPSGGTILGAFNIKYMPCTAIKGQVLANLVAEFIKHLEAGIVKEVESRRV